MILTETFWKNGGLPGEDGEEALQANTMAYARHSENFGLLFRSLSLLVTLAFPKLAKFFSFTTGYRKKSTFNHFYAYSKFTSALDFSVWKSTFNTQNLLLAYSVHMLPRLPRWC